MSIALQQALQTHGSAFFINFIIVNWKITFIFASLFLYYITC